MNHADSYLEATEPSPGSFFMDRNDDDERAAPESLDLLPEEREIWSRQSVEQLTNLERHKRSQAEAKQEELRQLVS